MKTNDKRFITAVLDMKAFIPPMETAIAIAFDGKKIDLGITDEELAAVESAQKAIRDVRNRVVDGIKPL